MKISVMVLLLVLLAYVIYMSATVYLHLKTKINISSNLSLITSDQIAAAKNTGILLLAQIKNGFINDAGKVSITYDDGKPLDVVVKNGATGGISVATPTAGISLLLSSENKDHEHYEMLPSNFSIALHCDVPIANISLAELQKFPKKINIEYSPAKKYTRLLLTTTVVDINNKIAMTPDIVLPALKSYEIIAAHI